MKKNENFCGLNKLDKTIINISMILLVFLSCISLLLFFAFSGASIFVKVLFGINVLLINILNIYIFIKCNTRFILNNDKIYKSNIFNKNKFICNISKNLSYSTNFSDFNLFEEEKKSLSIPLYWADNSELKRYVENNCKNVHYYEGQNILKILYLNLSLCIFLIFIYSELLIIGLLLSILLICCFIKESRIYYRILDNKINYRIFLKNNSENISDLKEIIYLKNKGFFRYKPYKNNYKVTFVFKNKRATFNYIVKNELDFLCELSKKNNIKLTNK